MDIKFHANDIITEVPTCCLIEDYWMLKRALDALKGHDIEEAKSEISCAMDCIMESIDRFTKTADGLDIRPSVNSAIVMSVESGIIMDGNKDLCCRAGNPLSDAGSRHCDDCPFLYSNGGDECDPESGYVLLENELSYNATAEDEDFVTALKNV